MPENMKTAGSDSNGELPGKPPAHDRLREDSEMADTKGDKTVLRSLGLGGFYGGGGEGMVDVKNGKILRVRPFHFDWKYDRDKIRTWKLEKNGKTLEPAWKSLLSPF